ncbi:alpha/beta-hydrolase [Acephala macrosclerotiorum]|nr:alpha/beta-hydrolase [Acephala macrosclerotiorum]
MLDSEGVPFSHTKPHGELFFYMTRDPVIRSAVLNVAAHYKVPVYGFQVALQPIDKPSICRNNYQKFNPREEILPAGWNGYNSRPLPCDIHVSHDVAIEVRDGCTLYCDLYRPAVVKEPVSAIVTWSLYGKKFNGIPNGVLSGLEKFEGPDPAIFCDKGFAVVNVDSRGCGDSEGTITIMGSQEAEDGYDVIEALAKMPWCSGSIGTAGNSHLAIIQWFIASSKPPSLKTIAPWEACGDLYREQFVRGGIFDAGLFNFIIKTNIQGNFAIEDFKAMCARTRKADSPYWRDKRADIEKIQIPTFISASHASFVYTMGSIRGWMQVDTPHKWFRICSWQEWYDIWNCPQSPHELAEFFDHFLNGKLNDFEKTPRVRISFLKFNADPICDIVEDNYPILRTEYKKMFFASTGKLDFAPEAESSITTRLAGLPKAMLHMSTLNSNDMDIYITIRKLDRHDHIFELPKQNVNNLMFHSGSMGFLRASRRHIDLEKSIHENYPFHTHARDEYLQKREVEGESLRVEVHGQGPLLRGEFPMGKAFLELASKGMHRVHVGGVEGSYIILPFV